MKKYRIIEASTSSKVKLQRRDLYLWWTHIDAFDSLEEARQKLNFMTERDRKRKNPTILWKGEQ